MTERNPHDVVRLATAQNPAHAHIIEQALKEEGIDAKVVGDYLDAGLGDISGLMPEVWVHRDDLERAQAIVDRGEQGTDEEDEQAMGEESTAAQMEPEPES